MRIDRIAGRRTVATLLAVGALAWAALAATQAQPAGRAEGVIAGKVTADRGTVRAFRVKARDTAHKITYTVFTRKGAYQIFHLPPGTYEVLVLEEGYTSPVQTVELRGGDTKTVDVAVQARPEPSVELV